SGLSIENINYDLDFNAKIVACSDLDPECSTVDAEFVSYTDNLEINAYDIYLEHEWRVDPSHMFTYGVRYGNDDYLKEGRLEPRIRWDNFINPELTTYASFGQYSQLPELREMIEVLGNKNLSTIKADHYVLGLSKSFGESWRFSSDIYYKKLSDIVISTEQDDGADNYSNNATGEAYGIEFLINRDLTDRWYGWASLSLSKTERTNTVTGKTIKFEYDKPILFNLVVNRLVGESWNLGIKWTFQSGGRYTPVTDLIPSENFPEVFEPVYGELNSEEYPDYHRLDFRAEYTSPKPWGYWKFYADILNVYNRDNIEEYEYAPDGQDLVDTPAGFGKNVPVKAEYSDGLIPSIGFEVQF
ncbi:MAG: TonB-dependent receptor, partial [Pseudomonadales bacterium]|nr:TonB-dependent receptor [Pseudomonadales bacterium]